MLPTADALDRAHQLYESGDHIAANEICCTVLDTAPKTAAALRLRALIALHSDDALSAVSVLQKAIEIEPEIAEFHDLLGTAYRKLGEFADATACYRHAIQLEPNREQTLNNLGACLYDQGQIAEAISCHERAIAINPQLAAAYYNLGNAWQTRRQLDKAVACYETALRIDPNYGRAYANLGAVRFVRGQLEQARRDYAIALKLLPDSAEIRNNLGAVAHEQGDANAAIMLFRTAIDLHPDYTDALANLADALVDQEAYTEAIERYESLRELLPEEPEVHNNLGVALQHSGRLEESIACYEQALSLNSDYAAAHCNLGTARRDVQEFTPAEAAFRQAIDLDGDLVEAHVGLANVLEDTHRFEAAMASYDEAIRLNPDNSEARFARGLALLRRGEFEKGWREYEWRWRTKLLQDRDLQVPRWMGEPLQGRTILIHAEQGLGDTIQFVRYLPLVKAAGARVLFAADSRLQRLLEHIDSIDVFVPLGNEMPAFDLHAPLLSLPHVFTTTLDEIPANGPYLTADAELVADWQTRLAKHKSFTVGVSWRGNPEHRRDDARSIPIEHFQELSEVAGITLISLQYQSGLSPDEESTDDRIVNFSELLDRDAGPFMDTAAIIKNLDLVVSCDTAVAHLAGALGVPVWLALDHAADWRWMHRRGDSPWYSTMRLFRQSTAGDWNGVFAKLRAALLEQAEAENRIDRQVAD
ncbi:MAG: tetratricopeptide repeat protein [Planctomycetes bacterium]|nr:tetratricopeptide repeat protein [Planctomycetota bacterium]